jgi:hypothetical protein
MPRWGFIHGGHLIPIGVDSIKDNVPLRKQRVSHKKGVEKTNDPRRMRDDDEKEVGTTQHMNPLWHRRCTLISCTGVTCES